MTNKFEMNVPGVTCASCQTTTSQVLRSAKNDAGNIAWLCPSCKQWNFAKEGEFIESGTAPAPAPQPVDEVVKDPAFEPLDLTEVHFMLGASFECPQCARQNFIPIERPEMLAKVEAICYNCSTKYLIDTEKCEISRNG